MISKEDFQSWKDHSVTQAFFEACEQRVEDAKEILASGAGLEPDQDNYFRGFIQAYREIQSFSVEDAQ